VHDFQRQIWSALERGDKLTIDYDWRDRCGKSSRHAAIHQAAKDCGTYLRTTIKNNLKTEYYDVHGKIWGICSWTDEK
jgi:hypothetical protein